MTKRTIYPGNPQPLLRKLALWLFPVLERTGVVASRKLRRQVFVSVECLLAAPFLVWLGWRESEAGTSFLSPLLLAGAVMLMLVFVAVRRGFAELVLTRFVLAYFSIVALLPVLLDRGPHQLYYLLLLPLIAVFVLGVKEGVVWGILVLVGALLLMDPAIGYSLPATEIGKTDFVVSYLILFTFSIGYESVLMRMEDISAQQNDRLQKDRKRLIDVQRELVIRESSFRKYADLATDWLFETDASLNLTYISPRFERATGHRAAEFVGKPVSLMIDRYERCDRDAHIAAYENHQPFRDFRYCLKSLDGRQLFVMSRGEPVQDADGQFSGYLCTSSDVTDYEMFQEGVRRKDRTLNHVQKLDAIGKLTGGVAHDFNNLLMVIKGNLEFLRFSANESWDMASVESIDSAVEQASDLTEKLLTFSKQQPLAHDSIDLVEALEDVSPLLRHSLGERISLEVVTSPDICRCLADRSQLGTAILNLALNARDAMEDKGRLVITARNLTLDESRNNLEPGNYVIVSVIDEGMGMPQNIVEKAAEPFFTTKAMGDGPGLGLSMVYGFVTRSGGSLQIESVEAVGTKVSLILPQATKQAPPDFTLVADRNEAGESMRAIMVEDESSLQNIVDRMLRLMGYETVICNNAEEALVVLKDYTPDLLLTDMMLGAGMDGMDLADQVKSRFPDARILMMSGYPQEILERRNNRDVQHELLRKPFGYKDLCDTLDELFANAS